MYRTICFFLLLSIVKAVDKGSLTFVIDHTASMSEEIEKVKEAARDIANNILNQPESEVQNIVLVTFDDPTAIASDGNYVRLITKTKNFNEFHRNLESITLVGNYDCPEMCLSGCLRGLQESDHGSLVYVFTDDSPKDLKWAGRDLYTEVMTAGQKNEHQIVFIITPRPSHCRNDGRDFMSDIQPYYEIAAATNGQVFNLDGKTEVGEALEYVKETISGQRTVIISKIIPADEWESVPFTIDAKTEYGIISTSGKAVELLLFESPVNATLTHVTWLSNMKVAKVSIAGDYVVKVKGGGVTSIVVFGRTDFVFKFGFSTPKPSSLSETSRQPMPGEQYYLLIQIEDKEGDVNITSVELLNTRNDLLLRVPVKMINDTMYLSELFNVPRVTFKIEVIGITKRGIIRRANRTPINPVLSPDADAKPLITKTDDVIDIEAVTGDLFVVLPCNASGYPKPEITWKMFGKSLPSAPEETINSEGTLYLRDVKLKHSGFYNCEARNIYGSDHVSYNLNVLNSPKPVRSMTTVGLRLGESRDIACNVPHATDITIPQDKVRWYKGSKMVSSDKILRIENASTIGVTKYTCRVSYWNKLYSETATVRVIVEKSMTNNTTVVTNSA